VRAKTHTEARPIEDTSTNKSVEELLAEAVPPTKHRIPWILITFILIAAGIALGIFKGVLS